VLGGDIKDLHFIKKLPKALWTPLPSPVNLHTARIRHPQGSINFGTAFKVGVIVLKNCHCTP
jgi:hypothetical protein